MVGTFTMRSSCGWPTAETETDRAAGKWEPGRNMRYTRDPDRRVRFCEKGFQHAGDHENVPEAHPEHWRSP